MDILQLLEIYIGFVFTDFLRYLVPASFAYLVFWVLLKKTLAHKFIQQKYPKRSRIWAEFGYSVSTAFIFGLTGLFIFLAIRGGYTQYYEDISEYGWPYLIFSVFAAIVIHDAYFYWTHRWMHSPKIYKHVHLVHHKSTNPSPWAAYSFHPIEAFVQSGIGIVLVFLIPMHPYSYLAFLTYAIILNVFGHFSYELFPKGFTKNRFLFWHNTTTHHNMHHRYFNYNYSLYFNWWDRLFGTMHPKYDEQFEKTASRKREPKAVEEPASSVEGKTVVA